MQKALQTANFQKFVFSVLRIPFSAPKSHRFATRFGAKVRKTSSPQHFSRPDSPPRWKFVTALFGADSVWNRGEGGGGGGGREEGGRGGEGEGGEK